MCSTVDAPEAKTTTTTNTGLQHATNHSTTAPPPPPSSSPPPDTLPTSIGFSSADLRTAVDVITKLQGTPAAFLENDALCASGIWRVINRKKSIVPRHEWKRSVLSLRKLVQKEGRRSERASSRRADAAAVAATGSVVARTTARKRSAHAFLAIERPSAQARLLQPTAAPACTETDATDDVEAEEAAAAPAELRHQRRCHICRAPYHVLHFFYHALCPACAALNHAKRQQTRDMRGAAVLVTGVRIKIGHQAALRLLRDGAVVVGTTRFPADAARRFAAEPDYAAFRDRLRLHALDLRDLAAVKAFCAYLASDGVAATLPPLVAVVHNAAQTIARPEAYYARLRVGEAAALEEDVARTIAPGWGCAAAAALTPPPAVGGGAAAAVSLAAAEAAFTDVGVATRLHEEGFAVVVGDGGTARVVQAAPFYDMHDSFNEACDTRAKTTWWTKLQDVSAEEAAAVHAVNCLAPFIINSLLRPVLERGATAGAGAAGGAKRFVVNVSAMEGQFYRAKTPYHPHTNMAKAAMNMMTRTAGPEFAEAGIYMTSVDTGWVTDMAPRPHQREGFTPPLDEVDGAARILDPIYTDSSMHTVLIKDYKPTDW